MDTTPNTTKDDNWQQRVHRHIVPAEQLPGKMKLLFSLVGDVPIADNESALLHFVAGKAYATIYVYSDMADVVPYLAVEQGAKINVFQPIDEPKVEVSESAVDLPMPIEVNLNLVSGDTKGNGSKD